MDVGMDEWWERGREGAPMDGWMDGWMDRGMNIWMLVFYSVSCSQRFSDKDTGTSKGQVNWHSWRLIYSSFFVNSWLHRCCCCCCCCCFVCSSLGLNNIKVIVKTSGAGFHMSIPGIKYNDLVSGSASKPQGSRVPARTNLIRSWSLVYYLLNYY